MTMYFKLVRKEREYQGGERQWKDGSIDELEVPRRGQGIVEVGVLEGVNQR